MVIFIATMVLMFLVDSCLVGIAFYALKNRFQWNMSFRTGFIILFLAFIVLDNYPWPMVHVLDLTYTVGNQEIAKFFDLAPNEPVENLLGFGIVDFVIWAMEALLATYIGEKLFSRKKGKAA